MHGIFLGTGTSQGVPVIGCNCVVCNSSDPRDNRLRTSFFLDVEGVHIVIDAGCDFRQQMLRNHIVSLDALLITHEHKDHLAGLDDIRPFNFMHFTPLPIYAEHRVVEAIKREFAYVFVENPYPGSPMMNVQEITVQPFEFKGIKIQPLRVNHLKLPILGYRVGQFAYITDCSFIPEETMEMLDGVECLVINALRFEEHYSHFCVSQALEVINKVKPKQAYLTHCSHDIGFYEETSLILPENVFLAYDGLQIDLKK
ncbi:MAG: MBL fold metallo-hydrolase [Bacteroidales bacterium]|nr:MBL fold metallo-hydrolase [Bacteroidales bacterium]